MINKENWEKYYKRENKVKTICSQLNCFTELKPTLTSVINEIKELTHCQAISVRLHDNDDYPYYVYNGFPKQFIEKENSLCSRDKKNNKIPLKNGEGFLLDCMCGNIIRGRFDPSLSFFTSGGSFWSNNTTALLASTGEEERQGRTRNYCNSCGYQSVALIPITVNDNIIGLVQLNDKRESMFTNDLIEYLEMICKQIGLAIDNSQKYSKILDQKNEISRNLEQLHETQKHIIEAGKMASLANIVAGVAHEINTPVGVAITASSAILEKNKKLHKLFNTKKLKQSDLIEYINVEKQTTELIFKNLNRAAELIKNFKVVSIDHFIETKRKFHLKSYLEDIICSLRPRIRKKNVNIRINCNKDLELNSYPGVFAQIVTNLIMNSLSHGFDNNNNNGEINIIIRKKHEKISLIYKDNGKGIPKQNLSKIFEPFFTTNKKKGTGLGMFMVYNLVTQLLKGHISCTSEQEMGVNFNMLIPVFLRKNHE